MNNTTLILVILNLIITSGIGGFLFHLNNKISKINAKIQGHITWHKKVKNKVKIQ